MKKPPDLTLLLFFKAATGLYFLLYICLHQITLFAQTDAEGKQSSYFLMSTETRAMPDNPELNPGLFWILDGKSLWDQKTGKNQISCADCHGQAEQSMRGIATGFPKMRGQVLTTIEDQINDCRVSRQAANKLEHESKPLVALTTFVVSQSKGLPITLVSSPEFNKEVAAGKQIFEQRIGQLNLSCAQCHEARAGLKLAGNPIPQAHPTSYPQYRIEWQAVGTLERRLRNCMIGVRAQAYAYDSQEIKQLEAYLMSRAQGMVLETPGVRP
jgi:sulfur-oxidizing protein SoxA